MSAVRVPTFAVSFLPADTDTPSDVMAALPGSNTRIVGGNNCLRLEGKAAAGSGNVYLYRYQDRSQATDPPDPANKGWWPWQEAKPVLVDAAEFHGKFSALWDLEITGPVDVILVFEDSLTIDVDDPQFIEGVRR